VNLKANILLEDEDVNAASSLDLNDNFESESDYSDFYSHSYSHYNDWYD